MKYILGIFQTDPLEKRFEQYRLMSGAVSDIFKSKEKLKLLSPISLHSYRIGKFQLKNVMGSFEGFQLQYTYVKGLHHFDRIEYYSNKERVVLVYIAGYIVSKVSKGITCKNYLSALLCNKNMEIDCDKCEQNEYLNLNDRGGLHYLKKYFHEVLMTTFNTFKTLISKKYESQFAQSGAQRSILTQLTKENIGRKRTL